MASSSSSSSAAAAAAAAAAADRVSETRDVPNYTFKYGDLDVTVFNRASTAVMRGPAGSQTAHHWLAYHESSMPRVPIGVPSFGTGLSVVGDDLLEWDSVSSVFMTPALREKVGRCVGTIPSPILAAAVDVELNGVVSAFLEFGFVDGKTAPPLLSHLAQILGDPVIEVEFPVLRIHTVSFVTKHFPGLLVHHPSGLTCPTTLMPQVVSRGDVQQLDFVWGVSDVEVRANSVLGRDSKMVYVSDNSDPYSMQGRVQYARREIDEVMESKNYTTGTLRVAHSAEVQWVYLTSVSRDGVEFWDDVRAFNGENCWGEDLPEAVEYDRSVATLSRYLRHVDGLVTKESCFAPEKTTSAPLWGRVMALCRDRSNESFVANNFVETYEEKLLWMAREERGEFDPRRYLDCYTRITSSSSFKTAVAKVPAKRDVKDRLVVDMLFSLLPIEESVEFENNLMAHLLWYVGCGSRRHRKAVRAIFHPCNHHAFAIFPGRLHVFRRTLMIALALLIRAPGLRQSCRRGTFAFLCRRVVYYQKILNGAMCTWYVSSCDREIASVVDIQMREPGGVVWVQSFRTMTECLCDSGAKVFRGDDSIVGLVSVGSDAIGAVMRTWAKSNKSLPDVDLLCVGDGEPRTVVYKDPDEDAMVYYGLPVEWSPPVAAPVHVPPASSASLQGGARKRKASSSAPSGLVEPERKKHSEGAVVLEADRKRARDDDDDDDDDADMLGLDSSSSEMPVAKRVRGGAPDHLFVRVRGGAVVHLDMRMVKHSSIRETAFWRLLTDGDDATFAIDDFSPSDPVELPMVTHEDLVFFFCAQLQNLILRSYLHLSPSCDETELVRRLTAQNFLGSVRAMSAVAFALGGQGRVHLVPVELAALSSVVVDVGVYDGCPRRRVEWFVTPGLVRAFALAPTYGSVRFHQRGGGPGGSDAVMVHERLVLRDMLDVRVFSVCTDNSPGVPTFQYPFSVIDANSRGAELMDVFFSNTQSRASVDPLAGVLSLLRGAHDLLSADTVPTILSHVQVFLSQVVPRDRKILDVAYVELSRAFKQVVPSARNRVMIASMANLGKTTTLGIFRLLSQEFVPATRKFFDGGGLQIVTVGIPVSDAEWNDRPKKALLHRFLRHCNGAKDEFNMLMHKLFFKF